MQSGIYKIRNTINNKVYIGKTKNFKQRWRQYKYAFNSRSTKHINEYLLNSMLKYGFDNFEFSIVEVCSESDCSHREIYWMDFYNSFDSSSGYNLRRDSGTGMTVSKSTSEKISNRLRKEWSDGVRKDHGKKVKESWKYRDLEKQSALMSANKTKYMYKVTMEDGTIVVVKYSGLVELGMKSVLSNFHRKKENIVIFKNITVERIPVNEDKT